MPFFVLNFAFLISISPAGKTRISPALAAHSSDAIQAFPYSHPA
jgi:hypothetical protein